jgi:hypothetical protein
MSRAVALACIAACLLIAVALIGWAHAAMATLGWGPTPVELRTWLLVNAAFVAALLSAATATFLARRARGWWLVPLAALAAAALLLVSFNLYTGPLLILGAAPPGDGSCRQVEA